MARPIWLQLNQSDSPHGDVVLSFGQTQQTEDSYYFALDSNVSPGDESPQKAALVMAGLLDQWLNRLGAGENAYLPVGFSDQSMTWLYAEQTGDSTKLTLGWSEDEGWSVLPSDVGDKNPTAFTAMDEVEPVTLYGPRLLSLVRSNRCVLSETANAAT